MHKVRKKYRISDMNISDSIRQIVLVKPQGAVFSSADFLSLGARTAVDQALSRFVRAGVIVRVARGLYAAAGQTVEPQMVASAVARKTGERVGFALLRGPGDQLIVPTSGVSRRLKAAGHTMQFRRMSQRKVQLACTAKGRVLLGLWAQGMKNLTTLEIARATGDWSQGEINSYAAMIPAWLRTAIERANAPRKSIKIGLSGAYDWSNPSIKDDVLIGNVLEKHRFEDVARLCFYYGIPKVRRVFKRRAFEPMTSASVSRMLGNISKGMRLSQEACVPEMDLNSREIDDLFIKKAIVVYERVKSRDIFDLMVLTRDHGYTLEHIFAAIDAFQPIRNKDPEHFKSVVTGVIPLDKNDEGFSSIHLNVKIGDVYKYFKKLINDYEINAVKSLRLSD